MVYSTNNSVGFRKDDSAIIVRSGANFHIERNRDSKFGCWYSLSVSDAAFLRDELTRVLKEHQ